MRILAQIGSKERFVEMMERVNKIKLNEDFINAPTQQQDSSDIAILEHSFNELKTGMLRIKRTNTQTSGAETYLELICFSQQGADTVFRFKIESSEGDQDGVMSVNDAELVSLTSDKINIPEGSVALQQFNAQHKAEMIDIVSEYADFGSEEPEIDEEFQKAVEKIESYPFTSKPRTMVTSKQYGDEKPTNPALRVKSPQLDKFVDENEKVDSYPFTNKPRTMVKSKQYGDEKPTNPALRVKSQQLDKFVDESAEHERYSAYSQDINSRLKAFADSHGENWVDLKNEFMREADPYNMKSPKDAHDAYFEIVDDFLSKNGMNEGNVVVNNPNTANLGQHYFNKASSARKIKAIQDAVKFYEEQGVNRNSMPPDKYLEMLKHTAELIFTGNIAALNEVKKKKKKAPEYPDQIGSHFVPKSDYPVEKKKPTKVVAIDEEEMPDDRVSDMGTGEKLNIGDVVTVDGLIGEYQVGVKHSEGKPFLMPFDMATKKANPTHRIYLTTLNNPKLTKVLSYAETNGGFMSESADEQEPSDDEEAKINKIEHDKEEHGEKLIGGKGDEATSQEFDQEQVLLGLKVEMEHTDDPTVALEIVLDHLTEDPEYYTTKDDPEASAQAGAAKDTEIPTHGQDPNMSNFMGRGMGALKPDDKEEEDVLLGFKPHNVGDEIEEAYGQPNPLKIPPFPKAGTVR